MNIERCAEESKMSSSNTTTNSSSDDYKTYYDENSWFEQLIGVGVPTLFSVIVLTGFIGNMLVVLVVLSYRRARTATSLLMLNLAVADLVFIVVCVPTTAARYALPVWPLGSLWCKIYQYTRTVTAYGSVYTLVLMAFDRYLAIVHPIGSIGWRTVRKTAVVMVVTWVLVSCGNCPEWYRVTEYTFENQTRSDCINVLVYDINESSLVTRRNRRIYYTTFFAVGYAMPLTIICVFYVLLVHRIGARRQLGVGGEVRSMSVKAAATRRRVMRMVTSVIVTFAVCWLPTHVRFLIGAYADIDENYRIEMVAFQIIATCLAYTNSCLNPVIYAFLSENFRQSFRELVSAAGRPVSQERRSRSSERRNRPRQNFRELVSAGGRPVSQERRPRSSERRNRPAGISNHSMDGQPLNAVPMVQIKLSLPINELSAVRTTLAEDP